MKRILFALLVVAGLWLDGSNVAWAQAANPDAARFEKIGFQDQEPLRQRSNDNQGGFAPLTVARLGNAVVRLEFPAGMANRFVRVAAMDGGQISGLDGGAAAVGPDGKLSFQFGAPSQSGVYRIVVISPNSEPGGGGAVVAVVQFEVPPTQ
ncbi:MAG: hypothetical protein ACREIW_10725 [Chthoniobacterales bacterium]